MTNNWVIPREHISFFTGDNDNIEGIGLNNLKIYLQGENLWTWQTHKGIDPEQGISGTTDSRSYNLRTMSLGFNIGF